MDFFNADQAAAMTGASASTIRGWCKIYAGELSAGANPTKGTERRLTREDVAKLQRIKAWRDSRMGVQEIKGLLQAAASDLQHLTIEATPTAPQEPPEASSLAPVVMAVITEHLAVMDRAQAKQRREAASLLITGLIMGATITLVVVALVLGMR